MDDIRPEHAAHRCDALLSTISPEALNLPPPQAEQEGPPQPLTAEAVREKAKVIAAVIAAKLPHPNRATRRALEAVVRAELQKNPVPTDPDCWLTPKKLIDKVLLTLGIAAFSIDVASTGAGLSYIPALLHFTKDDPDGCGLQRPWAGSSVWMNCPYSNIGEWVAKADEAVRSGRVGIVVALLPSRVNAPWFAEHVAPRARVMFLRQRVRFYAGLDKLGGSPKFGSMLCVWGGTPGQVAALEEAFCTASIGSPARQPSSAHAGPSSAPQEAIEVVPGPDAGDAAGEACLRTIDLFTGGGSVLLGMEAAGFKTVYANDLSPEKRATFSANFPNVRLDPRSITDIRGHELPKAGTMLASFPCQDHSKSGKRLGFAGGRGILAFEVVRLVRELAVLGRAPGVVVFENVLGLLEQDNGKDFATLVEALMAEGYDVGALVIDAKLFVPQSRRRLFIVAVRSGTSLPPGLEAGRASRRWHPTLLRRAHASLSAGARRCWHWWTIPNPPKRTTMLADILEPNVPAKAWATDKTVADMAALLPPQEQAKLARAVAQAIRVGIVKERRKGKGPTQVRHPEVFFDGCARCLQKSDKSTHQRVVLLDAGAAHGMRVRDFTPRERARLTGLPDDYILPGVTRSRRLTGDAVVVPVYESLARHLIRPLTEAAEASRKKAEVAPVMATRIERGPGSPGGARDAMGQVIVNPGANRPSKQVSKRTEVPHLLEAHLAIKAHAEEEEVSEAELYRRAMDFYRFSKGKPRVPKYVPLARNPELRPKALREAEAQRRGRRNRQAPGNVAGEGDISMRRRAFSVHTTTRLRMRSRLIAAQRPGTFRAISPRGATLVARAGWPTRWPAGPREAACCWSRSRAVEAWRSAAC